MVKGGLSRKKVAEHLRIDWDTVGNIDTMISLVMLFCSSIEIPWPGRRRNEPTNTGGK